MPDFLLLPLQPGSSAGKESVCSVGDLSSIPGLGRSPGEVKGYPLQYSGLENSMGYLVGSQVVKEAARNRGPGPRESNNTSVIHGKTG